MENALVARVAEPPALNRLGAGSSPAGCILYVEGIVMRRLISLFREPVADFAPSEQPQDQPQAQSSDEPEYFGQLLAYLRQRRAEEKPDGSQEPN